MSLIARLRSLFTGRRDLRRRVEREAYTLITVMPPDEAWEEARRRGLDEPAEQRLWYLVRREITRNTGFVRQPDTSTRMRGG
ncbi:hypothetical protein VSX64_01835 [Aurantimonas sp. C2-6-R+9]|uniref:hypothetical protein n=1 Tax=Aurantimonas sp. C2-6-R+9 TaxID=3114365 RepID=UPI002E18C321|nr:hypothetical protein [Aurantimonas sp. C2-6-R+9]